MENNLNIWFLLYNYSLFDFSMIGKEPSLTSVRWPLCWGESVLRVS